ncbi:hypothetical protein HGRIS_009079 [Hohenbuehelia grisea]|uniref:Uncharacterized protein n=1 Tax=Hohenbuehelia grisea TaxID=104357 RepID=A0ABR3J026_9AGAR
MLSSIRQRFSASTFTFWVNDIVQLSLLSVSFEHGFTSELKTCLRRQVDLPDKYTSVYEFMLPNR